MCYACYYQRKGYGVTFIVSRLELVAGSDFPHVRVLSMPWLTKTLIRHLFHDLEVKCCLWQIVENRLVLNSKAKLALYQVCTKSWNYRPGRKKKTNKQLGYVHAKTRWSWKRLLSNISIAQSGVFLKFLFGLCFIRSLNLEGEKGIANS